MYITKNLHYYRTWYDTTLAILLNCWSLTITSCLAGVLNQKYTTSRSQVNRYRYPNLPNRFLTHSLLTQWIVSHSSSKALHNAAPDYLSNFVSYSHLIMFLPPPYFLSLSIMPSSFLSHHPGPHPAGSSKMELSTSHSTAPRTLHSINLAQQWEVRSWHDTILKRVVCKPPEVQTKISVCLFYYVHTCTNSANAMVIKLLGWHPLAWIKTGYKLSGKSFYSSLPHTEGGEPIFTKMPFRTQVKMI